MITILLVMFGRLAEFVRQGLNFITWVCNLHDRLTCFAHYLNGEQLIIFRFLQGAGAALLISNSSAIITDAFPKNKLATGLGTNMMAANFGALPATLSSG